MPRPVKIEHFRNLVSLIAADGEIREIERITLSKIAQLRGIPSDRFNMMLQKAHEYQFVIPQNQEEKETQLQEMIELALIDDEFSKSELDLIIMVAEKLGFTPEELDHLIRSHHKDFNR